MIHSRMEEIWSMASMQAMGMGPNAVKAVNAGIEDARALCEFVGEKGWDYPRLMNAFIAASMNQLFHCQTTGDGVKIIDRAVQYPELLARIASAEQTRKPFMLDLAEETPPSAKKIILTGGH